MSHTDRLRIAVFFTHGVSLALWDERGIFSREVRFYQSLAETLGEVWFFTYGMDDGKYRERLGSHIFLFEKRLPVPNALYGLLLPFIYWKQVKLADLLRIHQMAGAVPALIARWLMRKPLVVRCGYQWSKFLRGQSALRLKQWIVAVIESITYHVAQAIIVTAASHAEYVVWRYHISKQKVSVISNYIDGELFKPLNEIKEKNRLCFVGRLEQEKNLVNLVTACEGLGVQLILFGNGSLKNELKRRAAEKGVQLSIRDPIPNDQLPRELNQCSIFILPSFHEGNPKSLLEAMACGLSVIGTNVEGINEIVENGKNGLLCEPGVESIRSTIEKLFHDPSEQMKLGRGARETILSTYSLSTIINKEQEVLRNIAL